MEGTDKVLILKLVAKEDYLSQWKKDGQDP